MTTLPLSPDEAEALRVLLFGWAPTPTQDQLLNALSDRLGMPTDPLTGRPASNDPKA
jgi:hypothetical protein